MRTLLLIAFVACWSFVQGQKLDSLQRVLPSLKEDTAIINTLNAISVELSTEGDYQKAIKFANEAFVRASKINSLKGKAGAFHSIGWYYKVQFNYPQAFSNYFKVLELAEKTGDKKVIAHAYLDIAGLYFNQGNYGEHLKNQYQALRLFEELEDKDNIARTLNGIGTSYMLLKNDSEALKNLEAALQLRKENGDIFGLAETYNTIGVIYSNQEKFDEALKDHFLAMKIFRQPGAPNWGIPVSYSYIGNIYLKQGELKNKTDKGEADILFAKAIASFLASSAASDKAGNKKDVADAYVQLGTAYLKLGKFSDARNYLHKALELSLEIKDKEAAKSSYSVLSTLDSSTSNYKLAYLDYRKYIDYKDSLINEENTTKALQAETQYNLYKEAAEKQQKRNVQLFSIVSLILLVLVFVVIAFIEWRNNKQKQLANTLLIKQTKQLETTLSELKTTQDQLVQREKLASLGELTAAIAHEIENPLNFVNNFSEVSSELVVEMEGALHKGDNGEAIAIAEDVRNNLEKINHHGKRADAIVKGMLQHSRANTGKKELTDINALADEYLRLSYHGLRAKDKDFNADFKTDFDDNIGQIEVVPQDIGRVLLNLFNNAFYAVNEKKQQLNGTFEPQVTVATKRTGDKVEISVKDNGNGIAQKVVDKIFQPFFTTKPTGQGTGLGLSLSYDIVKAHGGELRVETKEGEGAVFTVKLPIV